MSWLRGLISRRAGRMAATAAGVAIAVALLGSLGSFLSASKATMTSRAVAQVSVDWQVQAQPGADPAAVLETTRAFVGVRAVEPVALAATPGLEARVGASTQSTGPGVVLGIPDGYAATFGGAIRSLAGALDGVLVAQQTAANLHVAPGDSLSIGQAGLAPAMVTVAGVVDLPQADSLFQVVGAPPGAQPQAPPDNVVVVPQAQWHELFDPLAATRPDQVEYQVHVRLDRRLPADPNAAYTAVAGRARNLELKLAGAGRIGDNLGATLAAARGDALYAQVLFLFLGLPGAVLAALLTGAIAGIGADRRRREQALLRTRGATTRQLVSLGMAEAVAVGGIGALGGLGLAGLIGQASFGTARFGATTLAAAVWGLGAAGGGLVIAGVAVAVPAWRDARNLTVARARAAVGRTDRAPLWARLGLDFGLLAGSGLVFWLTGRNGYKLVLAPEGTSSISVDYWALAGPLLLWVGAGLLAWRLADLVLGRGRRLVAVAARPVAGRMASTVAATMSRQRRLLARGVVLVGLTLSFAASTAVFNATYRQQAGVDARLTNGGEVTVTESPGAGVGPSEATRLGAVRGVKGVEALQH
ncbi:MAG: ABC transporter permease, partial [Actinomycetota bacterium]|nr:ABC transporter permease [Actinomycetota bacterium]